MKKTKMLKKNYEFNKIFSKGKYFAGKTIEAFILDNGDKTNYLGLAVSTKSGKAYQRNRVKRLLRENYYALESQIKDGFTVVFLWKKKCNIEDAEFHQIEQDMVKILKNSEIFIEK